MKRGVGIVLVVIVTILTLAMFSCFGLFYQNSVAQSFPIPEGKLIFVDDDFTNDPPNHKWNTITEALNDATHGDVIFVFEGTYAENIFISNSVLLLGESRDGVIIDGTGELYAVNILANNVVIRNFTVINNQEAGIFVSNGYQNISIDHCKVSGSSNPSMYGIEIIADDITIENCTITNVHTGIYWKGSHNLIKDTTIVGTTGNVDWGVIADEADNGTIDKFNSSDIENKSIVIQNSDNITVINAEVTESFTGIWIIFSHNIVVDNTLIHNNNIGVRLDDATNNHIFNCHILDNFGCGIYSDNSFSNTIHHNNFVNNGVNGFDMGLNSWNTSIGNYYDDYAGPDTDGNGIGDIPYTTGLTDYRPLINPITTPPSFVWVDDAFSSLTPGWLHDHFSSIQAGIDNVTSDGTIYVYNGTYYEEIAIHKPLSIIGQMGSQIFTNGDAIQIFSGNVNIDGLSIRAFENGIKILGANNVMISNCYIGYDTLLLGVLPPKTVFSIYLVNSINCSIINCSISDSDKGIYLFNTSYSTIHKTHIHNNSYFGIELSHRSTNNLISDCYIADNEQFGVYILNNSDNNRIWHNNMINNPSYDAASNMWGSLRSWAVGNFWSGYTGNDSNMDGMGDAPIHIEGGAVEYHPLMNQITNPPQFVWVNKIYNSTFPGWNLDHFRSINSSLQHLLPNGSCYIFPGVYKEQIQVTKSVSIVGDNNEEVIIDGMGKTAFLVESDNSSVRNLSIVNCWNGAGMQIIGNTSTFLNLVIENNYNGLVVEGDNIGILGTKIMNNSYAGLIANNVGMLNFSYNKIFKNNQGLILIHVDNSLFTYNTIDNNSINGLFMRSSSTNNVFHHNLFTHTNCGFRTQSSSNNTIYLNDFIKNKCHANDSSDNHWDNGSIGNYWDDYGGNDSNYDGIGDSPYSVPGNSNLDQYPLIKRVGLPLAYFEYEPILDIDTSTIVQFYDFSVDLDGKIVTWMWDFADGNISDGSSTNITHRYADNGTYNVTLTVTDNDANSDSISQSLFVANVPPVVNFTWQPLSPTGVDIITFTDNSSDSDGELTNWTWIFGDGNMSHGPNVTHTYASSGLYLISLTVTDDDGDTSSKNISLEITNAPPTAEFNYTPMHPSTADTINLIDASIDEDGEVVNWSWDLGDGSKSYTQSPEHQYDDNGTYTVTLTIMDNTNISAAVSKNITVLNQPPYAEYTIDPSDPTTVDLVTFTDQSVDHDGTIVSWFWEFGDGKNSTAQNNAHSFPYAGIFKVNLTVTDDDGNKTTIQKDIIIRNAPPIADFRHSPQKPTDIDQVSFYDESGDPDGSVISYYWTFGDSNNSNQRNPTHHYIQNGVYTVRLTVTDNDGDTDSATRSITITNVPPIVNFTYAPNNPTDRDIVIFTANASDPDGILANFSWSFGDGNTSYGMSTNHTYADDGSYNVTLEVTDDDDDATSHTRSVLIANIKPQPAFSFDPENPEEDEYITFIDLSSDQDGTISNISWDFGDGTLSKNGDMINHKYNDSGSFTVTLTVTDDDGATAVTSQTIEVDSKDETAGFEIITLLGAFGVITFMWFSKRGVWRRRRR